MSGKTYFGAIPRDINQMTLYYLSPEEFKEIRGSIVEFQRICQDPRFLANYAREKLLLSPQVGQTCFLPRSRRFHLLGEIGYQPLISYVINYENDISTNNIADITEGAAKAGYEDIVNWLLEMIESRVNLPCPRLCMSQILRVLTTAAIQGNHLDLAERIFNREVTRCGYLAGSKALYWELGKRDLYALYQRFMRNVPDEDKVDFEIYFVEGALSVGNLRYFNDLLMNKVIENVTIGMRNHYAYNVINAAVRSGDPNIVNHVLEQFLIHNLNIRDYMIPEIAARGNPTIWNLRKEMHNSLDVDIYAAMMGGANQSETYESMVREFALTGNIVNDFIEGLAGGGHFQMMFSKLDQARWPKDINYDDIIDVIIHDDDVESFIRLIQGLTEHGISIETSLKMSLIDRYAAKDILKWMKIHEMLPLDT